MATLAPRHHLLADIFIVKRFPTCVKEYFTILCLYICVCLYLSCVCVWVSNQDTGENVILYTNPVDCVFHFRNICGKFIFKLRPWSNENSLLIVIVAKGIQEKLIIYSKKKETHTTCTVNEQRQRTWL